ncbi:MAG: NAD(P)-dependent oxidoreductase [Candidatus Fermentibacteraceae bacterium]|nr:NAD(P)-dependent oxidoreductase [Candidatus Fermentibacteraceae bacterium]
MSRWLVTGGSGFLGINLIRALVEKGHEVVSIDIAPFTYPDMVDRIDHRIVDIRDRKAVDECMSQGIDVFMHGAAALPLYKKSDILSTNIDGSRNVFESAKEYGVNRGIYISSTAVYGIPEKHPLFEDDPLVGVGPYGYTKIEAEKMVKQFREKGMTITNETQVICRAGEAWGFCHFLPVGFRRQKFSHDRKRRESVSASAC